MATLLIRATANVLRTLNKFSAAKAPLLGSGLAAEAASALPLPATATANSASVHTVTPVRMMSCCKQNCIRNPPPRCDEKVLKATPCHKSREKCKDTSDPECSPFKSMWHNPACCRDPCADAFPRFDDLYYRTSDKATREYQQTWNECPDLVVRKKPICCFEKICMPKYKKRPPACCPKTACPPERGDNCKRIGNHKCPKTTMPCCGAARTPPKCKKERKPSCCQKVCCPYPSFSECCRNRPPKRRPVECKCLRPVNMCEVYSIIRNKPWLLQRPSY